GLFFYTKIGSIISIGDLPTTNIIEPLFTSLKTREHIKSTMELFHKYVSFLIQEIKIKMINFLKIGDLPTL
ncbi:hypothetical protein RLM94_11050, partial [Streptococcus pneumoniae]|nr:hypothetical protein [Streptococcus pneumoniae]MDS9130792.1 hypothetical protein [Streptococcus pneumoniae]